MATLGSFQHAGGLQYHEPVMLREVTELLLTDPDGLYIDGTVGGGGHAAVILPFLRDGKLLAFDVDPEALAECRRIFHLELAKGANSRLELVKGSYEQACSQPKLTARLQGQVRGIILDLGVSSHQLDEPSRGFSYRFDAPLDMRFGGNESNCPPASQILRTISEKELSDVLFRYGQERFSRRIARAIVTARERMPISTTGQLRSIIEHCVPYRSRYDVLSRVFQALRIAVNDELGQLERFIKCAPHLLCRRGRIVVISYHSLEDRLVKHTFRSFRLSRNRPRLSSPILNILTPKPLRPSKDEVARNPRSRSARLRAAERLQ